MRKLVAAFGNVQAGHGCGVDPYGKQIIAEPKAGKARIFQEYRVGTGQAGDRAGEVERVLEIERSP
jgi:hypothetical protein